MRLGLYRTAGLLDSTQYLIMRVLSLDSSGSCTGYAVLDGLEPAQLIDGGHLKPSLARSALSDLPAWLHDHLRAGELDHVRKVLSIVREIRPLIDEHQPTRIVCEVASGKIGSGAKRGARGSLTTYGMAAWTVYAEATRLCPGIVVPITERQWTRGGAKKDHRPAAVAAIYGRRYEPAQDPGADLADATLMGRWWLGRSVMAFGASGRDRLRRCT